MAHPAKGPGGAWAMDDPSGAPWWPWCPQAYDYQQLQAQQRRFVRDDPRIIDPRTGPEPPASPWPPGPDPRPFDQHNSQQQHFREQRGPGRPQEAPGGGAPDPPGAPWGFPPVPPRQYQQHPVPQYYDYERQCHPAEYDQQPSGPTGRVEEREAGPPFPFPAAAGFHLPMDPSMAGAMPRRELCGQERAMFASPRPGGAQHAESPWGHGAPGPGPGPGSRPPWERIDPRAAMDPRGFPPLPPEDHQMQHQLTPMGVAMNYWEGQPGIPAWPSFKAPPPQQQQRRHQQVKSPRMPPLMHPNARQHNRRFEQYLQMGGAAGGGPYEAHRQQQGGPALRSHPASSQWEVRGEAKTPRTPWGAGGSSDSGATTPWRAQDAMWPIGCAPPHHDHPHAPPHPHANSNLYRRLSRGGMALPPDAANRDFEPAPPPWATGAGPWHHEPIVKHPEPVHGTVVTEEVDSRPHPPAPGTGAAGGGGSMAGAKVSASKPKASKPPLEKKPRREKQGPLAAGLATKDLMQAGVDEVAAAAAAATMPAPAEVRGRLLPREQMEWWADPEQRLFVEQDLAAHQHGHLQHPGLSHSRLQHRGLYQQGWPSAGGRSCLSAEGFGITGVGSCGGSVNTSPSVRAEIAGGASTGEKFAVSEGGEGATSAKANRARGRGRASRSLRRGRGAAGDKEAGIRKRRRHERRQQQQQQQQQQQHTMMMTSYEADESNLAASDRGSMSPVVRSPAYAIVGSGCGRGSPVTEDGPSATQTKKAAEV